MSSSNNWQDRRGLFQKGKEIHEPSNPTGRKFSETGVTNALRRSSQSSNSSEDKGAAGSFPTASPRRASGASGAMFGNLQNMKRGSQDYSERRSSQQDQAGGGGGFVSGWFNSTFKGGAQKPSDSGQK